MTTPTETIERIAQTVGYEYPRFEMTEAQAAALAPFGLTIRPLCRTEDGCIIFVDLLGQARRLFVVEPNGTPHKFFDFYGVR